MDNILKFKQKARELGLCDEYLKKWDEAKSKKGLLKIALDANGADFLCDSVAFKWGLKPKEIESEFASLINGKYVCKYKEGYTSELYVNYKGEINLRTDILVIIGGSVDLTAPDFMCSKIYLAGKCSFRMPATCKQQIITYGRAVLIGKKHKVEKAVLKSEWLKE